MNIDEMTPEEKSVALAGLCGWELEDAPRGFPAHVLDESGEDIFPWQSLDGDVVGWAGKYPNLYDPANMHLAWRVGVWAGDNLPNQSVTALNDFWMRKDTYPYKVFMWYEPEAQRLWLDKVLQLAIDAGLLPLQERAE